MDLLYQVQKMGNSFCIQLCLILFFAIVIPSHCSDHHLPEGKVSLFVFGDSLLDPGNNNYINTTTDFQANFSPYGETFFKYPTGRFSDGRLIQDFIGKRSSCLTYSLEVCFLNIPRLPSQF